MNAREFAESIDVAHGTVKRWLHEGMPAVRGSGHRLAVDVDAAKAWIAARYPKSIAVRRRSHVYFAQRATDGAIKIGFTSNIVRRVPELRKETHDAIELLAAIPGGKPLELELHARFADERIERDDEWFQPSDRLVEFVEGLGRRAA